MKIIIKGNIKNLLSYNFSIRNLIQISALFIIKYVL